MSYHTGLLRLCAVAVLAAGTSSCALVDRIFVRKALPMPTPEELAQEKAREEEKAKTAEKLSSPALFEWKGDDVPGPLRVTIDLSEQKARLTKGGTSVGWTYVATGTANHRTPTGSFSIQEKVRDKHSNTYGVIVNRNGAVVDGDARRGRERIPAGGRFVGAPMPYWMRLTGYGIGMHKGPIPNPGSPASHGCIRLPEIMAAKIFSLAPVGTTVTIRQ